MNRFLDFIRRHDRFAIVSHLDPDGDAVGSGLGLAWILRAAGKKADFLSYGIPRTYQWVPGVEEVKSDPDLLEAPPDGVFVVDATSPSRLGKMEQLLTPGLPVANIDHHPDNTRFGEVAWVDPSAAAAALMIWEMARELELPVGHDAATCLYVGLVTDTGRFTYSNTDARSIAAAADLIEGGADPHQIAGRVYENNSVEGLRLLGLVLSTLDLRDDGQVASLHVTRAMLEETGAMPEDADGFSTYARSIEGVKVGLFFRESEDGTIKVSFRSNQGVHIDGVAGRLGGGGHPSASGARVPGPMEAAKESVLRAVSEHLRSLAA
jgi:phosphoesterase RecJ-like protein